MKVKVIYSKKAKELNQPIFSRAIIETNGEINLLRAEVDREKTMMILDVPEKKVGEFTDFMKKYDIQVTPIKKSIILDKDLCIDCGACVSICPTDAIYIDNHSVELNEPKCVLCKACINVCPLRALKIEDM